MLVGTELGENDLNAGRKHAEQRFAGGAVEFERGENFRRAAERCYVKNHFVCHTHLHDCGR